jgi:hypothetical protein
MQQQGTYVNGFLHEDRHIVLVGQTRGVCKSMESSLFEIKSPRYKTEKVRIPSSNYISLFNNLTIIGSLECDSHVQD